MAASAAYSHKYTRFRDESDSESPTRSPAPSTRWWPSPSPLQEALTSLTRIGRSAGPVHTLLASDEFSVEQPLDSSPVGSRSKKGWLRVKWQWLRPHLQLSAESYVGLIFWTALVEFIRNVYWFQLQNGGVAPEIGFLAYLVIPAVVLGQPFLREFLDLHPWTRSLLLLCGLVGVWGQSERTPLKRVSFSGNSVAIMSVYVFEGVWTGSAARRRRTGFGMVGGVLLLQALRWAYAGPNPIVATTWGFVVIGVLPGLCTAFLILSEDVAEWEGEDLAKLQGQFGSEKTSQKRNSVDRLSDDWDLGGGEDVHGRVFDFERTCRLGLAGYDEAEDVEMLSVHPSKRGRYHHIQEEVQLADFSCVQAEYAENTLGTVRRLSFDSGEDDVTLVAVMSSHVSKDRELVEMNHNSMELSEAQTEGAPAKGNIQQWVQTADGNVPATKVLLREISLECWEDEMIGKRWGEGEEVPWANELGGLGSSCDSEMNMYRKRGWKWTKAGCSRTLQMGVGFGSLLFLTHWLFTSSNTFSRWSGASVNWGWLSVSSLALGLVFAAEVARNHLPKQVQSLVAWLCVAAGAFLLLQGATSAVIGGAILSFAVPSLWVMMPRNIFGVYPGSGLAIAILVYLLLLVWSTALFAYQSFPGSGHFLRGTKAYIICCTVIGVGVGLGRGPNVSPQEKWEFGERMGAWRTGALTWGSGVPSRQAVGTLIVLVGITMTAALVVRVGHADIWRGWNLEGDLRIINFNVQQGFSRSGKLNYNSLYNVFTKEQPHVIMLQESDTMHIVHGNMDLVDYLATWMQMRSLYTPPTNSDTWGCAMLSVLGLKDSSWELLPAPVGENACLQHAKIIFKGKSVHLVNAHFGVLEDEIVLQAQRTHDLVLGYLGNSTSAGTESQSIDGVPLIFAGDINAAPLSTAYNNTLSSGLVDSYVLNHGQWNGEGHRDPGAGYIFSSLAANCSSWEEPHYDQQKTSDGYPIVATFNFEFRS